MLSFEELKKNYSKFPDEKLIKIASKESKGLLAPAVQILIGEIKKRGLNPKLIEWINAERRVLSELEKRAILNKIKNSVCTICNLNSNLIGARIKSVISFIIGHDEVDQVLIACSNCVSQSRKTSLFKTTFLGWWSITGLIVTPFVLLNKIPFKYILKRQHREILNLFIDFNIGRISLGNDSAEVIQELLEDFNKRDIGF